MLSLSAVTFGYVMLIIGSKAPWIYMYYVGSKLIFPRLYPLHDEEDINTILNKSVTLEVLMPHSCMKQQLEYFEGYD